MSHHFADPLLFIVKIKKSLSLTLFLFFGKQMYLRCGGVGADSIRVRNPAVEYYFKGLGER